MRAGPVSARRTLRRVCQGRGQGFTFTVLHLHVRAHTQEEAQVHAEGADVGARLAGHPEDDQVALRVVLYEPALVHGAHPQLALDGRDQGRPLE